MSPAAKPWHADIVDRLRDALRPLADFAVVNDFACLLAPRSMPEPDLAAVRRDRWRHAVTTGEWLAGSPELVIEVSSPSNGKLHRKADVYLDHGAEQVWIVYRKTRTVTVDSIFPE